ncbi:putative small ubiquitin-related modifier [Blattamonas nauphoetae]|uniref:Small ubiquitin-related modifier n=1 Tax=Blattamonas nauphoetae TaxID=2049346 RepID=A0ABQ9WKK5_9EUKA|nr:putative small ubiquitin-related modifier [Blattamonas nauphoetae]
MADSQADKGIHLNVKVRSATGGMLPELFIFQHELHSLFSTHLCFFLDYRGSLLQNQENTALKKLMDAYCTRENLIPASVRFMFDGNRLKPTDTPEKLDMEDGDMIDASVEQTGGF